MIQDARVFRDEFIPKEIQRRNQELNALSSALHPVERGETADTTFEFGPSGTGKTCIARYILRELEQKVFDVETTYINCWHNYTRYSILYGVLDGLNRTVNVHRQSTPQDELLQQVREYEGNPYVVVLDEVDQLEEMDVLYDLYQTPKVSLIMIANERDQVFSQLDERLSSRLYRSREITFDRYSNDVLVEILQSRAEWGLHPDLVSDDVLERMADLAAGDARKAVGILRNAARMAEEERADEISHSILDSAVQEANLEVHRKHLDQLKAHQRVLFNILQEHGELEPAELYNLYEDRVDEPKTDRTVRNYLSKMEHYNLVSAQGEKRGRTYRIQAPQSVGD